MGYFQAVEIKTNNSVQFADSEIKLENSSSTPEIEHYYKSIIKAAGFQLENSKDESATQKEIQELTTLIKKIQELTDKEIKEIQELTDKEIKKIQEIKKIPALKEFIEKLGWLWKVKDKSNIKLIGYIKEDNHLAKDHDTLLTNIADEEAKYYWKWMEKGKEVQDGDNNVVLNRLVVS